MIANDVCIHQLILPAKGLLVLACWEEVDVWCWPLQAYRVPRHSSPAKVGSASTKPNAATTSMTVRTARMKSAVVSSLLRTRRSAVRCVGRTTPNPGTGTGGAYGFLTARTIVGGGGLS